MAVQVTDTHPLLWYTSGHHRKLSPRALRLFEAADEDRGLIYVPAVALWETALLARRGRIALRNPFREWAERLFHKRGFDLAPLDVSVIEAAGALHFTQDPFDGAIVATALTRELPLITADGPIQRANVVETIW